MFTQRPNRRVGRECGGGSDSSNDKPWSGSPAGHRGCRGFLGVDGVQVECPRPFAVLASTETGWRTVSAVPTVSILVLPKARIPVTLRMTTAVGKHSEAETGHHNCP
jgi:hypothetical protein